MLDPFILSVERVIEMRPSSRSRISMCARRWSAPGSPDAPLCSGIPRTGVLRRTRRVHHHRGLMRPSLRSQASMCAHALLSSMPSSRFQRMSSGRRRCLGSQMPSLCRYEHPQAQLKKSLSISSPCDWPVRPSVHALISCCIFGFLVVLWGINLLSFLMDFHGLHSSDEDQYQW